MIRTPRLRLALARAAAAVTLGTILAVGGTLPARADVVCTDDDCDGGQWKAARGAADQNSYWGMGAGHDCTNYVAWKLSTNGVTRPATHPGNAADWAASARADDYLVDAIPSVGAVAQWGAFAAGSPLEGHVAYVEAVNADGTILVSEDSWHADGTGPLRFRVLDPSTVSHFIHYGDSAAWLRQVVAAPGAWSQRSTGVMMRASLLSAVSMGGRNPQVALTQDGELRIAAAGESGWRVTTIGTAAHTRSISAVNMGGLSPTVVSLDGNRLMITTRNLKLGWSTMYTGIEISGEMAAVNAGGPWPTILVAQDGGLYTVINSGAGWFVQSTGVGASGPITATSTGGALIDAYALESGVLQRLWFDGSWWHKDSTGLEAHGTVAAVAADGTSQAVVAEGGQLSYVFHDSLGWHRRSTGVAAGTTVTAADLGGIFPTVFQTG